MLESKKNVDARCGVLLFQEVLSILTTGNPVVMSSIGSKGAAAVVRMQWSLETKETRFTVEPHGPLELGGCLHSTVLQEDIYELRLFTIT